MLDIKKEVREESRTGAVTKIIPVVRSVKQIKQLADVVEMIQEHVFDECYECESDSDKIELMQELLDEFFEIVTTQEVREDLLALARKSTVVRIDRSPYLCFSVIQNLQYELILNGESMYYEGSLEDLESLEQLEKWQQISV